MGPSPQAAGADPRSHCPPTPPSLTERFGLIAIPVCIMLFVAARSLAPGFAPGAFHDDGVYLSLGKAIATGHGYHSIYEIGSPVHAKYPPALPLLFAMFWWLATSLRAVMRLVFAGDILAVGATALLLLNICRRLEIPRALACFFALGPLLLNPSVTYLTLAIAEPYYLMFCVAAIVLFDRARSLPNAGVFDDVALGACLAIACLFRSQALVLLPATLLALFIARVPVRRIAITAATAALPLLVWEMWHTHMLASGPLSHAPDELPYLQWLTLHGIAQMPALLVRIALGNARDYAWLFIHLLSDFKQAGVALALLFAAAFTYGWQRALKVHPALALCVAASALTVLLWPFAQDRLMLSWLPLAGVCAAFGVVHLALRHRATAIVAGVVLIAATISIAQKQTALRRETLDGMKNGTKPSSFVPDYVLLYNSRFVRNTSLWLRLGTRADEAVFVDFPAAIYLNSGRVTLAANPTESAYAKRRVFNRPGAYLRDHAVAEGINVVVVAGPADGMRRDVRTVSTLCPDALIRQNDLTIAPLAAIYRIDRSVLRSRGDACVAPVVTNASREER